MAKDTVVGHLNTSIVDVNYDGAETSTAVVAVDNGQRTISVEVKKTPHSLTLYFDGKVFTFDGSEDIEVTDEFLRALVLRETENRIADVDAEEERATLRENDIDERALHKSFHGEPVKEYVDGEKV